MFKLFSLEKCTHSLNLWPFSMSSSCKSLMITMCIYNRYIRQTNNSDLCSILWVDTIAKWISLHTLIIFMNALDLSFQLFFFARQTEQSNGAKLTSCARSRRRVSSTASFFVVSVLSRNDVRRTDCALFRKKNKHRFEIDECYLFGKVIEFVIVKVELQSCVNNDSCVVIQKSYWSINLCSSEALT